MLNNSKLLFKTFPSQVNSETWPSSPPPAYEPWQFDDPPGDWDQDPVPQDQGDDWHLQDNGDQGPVIGGASCPDGHIDCDEGEGEVEGDEVTPLASQSLRQKTSPAVDVCFPALPPIIVSWSKDMTAKQSETQYDLQKKLIQSWKDKPILGFQQEHHTFTSKIVAKNLATPNFGDPNDGTKPPRKLRCVIWGVVSEKPFHIYRFYGEKKKKRVPEENGQKEKERESEKKIKKRRAAADNLMSEAFWENV